MVLQCFNLLRQLFQVSFITFKNSHVTPILEGKYYCPHFREGKTSLTSLANFTFQSSPPQFASATRATEAQQIDAAALAGNKELLCLRGALDSIMF